MADHLDDRPSSSYLNVGHHAFVQATHNAATPLKSSDKHSRPQSKGRDSSPMARRASSFGLNILKVRGTRKSTSPEQKSPRDVSPQPPSRKAPAPPMSVGGIPPVEQYRGRSLPGVLQALDDPMAPLPLPPTIPGARGMSNNRSPSRDRPSTSGSGTATGSRPGTPLSYGTAESLTRPSTPGDDKKNKRKSLFGGGKLQKKQPEDINGKSTNIEAFVMRPDGKEPYNLSPLMKGQPVPELWDQNGNMFVHLYPNANASFRLDASTIASARGLQKLISGGSRRARQMSPTSHMRHMSLGNALSYTENRSARSSSVGSADYPWSPSQDEEPAEIHLQMPIMVDGDDPTPEDIDMLLTIRNMFAFLIGQLIVGTPRMPTLFSIFSGVADMLKKYEFSNFDGSTMGEAAEAAFLGYVADLRLDDVRKSREKTTEALILGERMKCWALYNEAYVHGVGKWNDIIQRNPPLFNAISPRTKTAMEKSARDLHIRLTLVREHLEDFTWPGLFAGFMNSKSVKASVEVDAWKNAWVSMRKHVLGHYKKQYGNWPPKAKSKKNEFEESGLNRSLLQSVYQDFTDLYDLLVNRDELTERTVDSSHGDTLSEDTNKDALRKLLSEFDRSLTPVRPPIPYDLPKLPDFAALKRDTNSMDQKKRDKETSKKLKDNDLTLILMDSYNRDSLKNTPFVEAFMAYERSLAHGRSANELINIRIGQWVFLYVVLQMLPLLVVDAPGLRWTKGVEYFLCEVPRSTAPWQPEREGAKAYYRVASTGGVVAMNADAVEHGVEGIYRRSHCWVSAARWSGQDPLSLLADTGAGTQAPLSTHPSESQSRISSISGGPSYHGDDSLAPPPGLTIDGMLAVSGGGGMRAGSRNSLMPGLEALPMPQTLSVDPLAGSRRQSVFDPSASFDAILGTMDTPTAGKKKGKK